MRRTAEDIAGRRRARETTFLVTGGTGFIGSHIAAHPCSSRGMPSCYSAGGPANSPPLCGWDGCWTGSAWA